MIHPAQSPFTLWPGSAAPTTPWLGTAPSLGSPAYHLYTPISQQGPLDTEFIGAATAHDAEAADQGVDAPASGLKFGEDLTPAPKTRKTLAQLQMGRRSIATKRHHTSPFPEFKAKNNVFPIQPRTRAGMSRAKTLPAHLPVRVWTREIEDEPSPALALLWPVTPGTAILSSPTKLKTKTKPEDTRVAAQDSVGPASPLVRGNRLKFSKSMPVIKTPAKWSLKPVSGTPTFPSIKAKRSALTEDSESSGGAANKKTRVVGKLHRSLY